MKESYANMVNDGKKDSERKEVSINVCTDPKSSCDSGSSYNY
jgi:hypothetical protein